MVVPVGVVWQRVCKEHPEIVLYDRDGSRPSLAGSYLAACVFVATLFGKHPVGAPPADRRNNLEPAACKILQDAAWGMVRPGCRERVDLINGPAGSAMSALGPKKPSRQGERFVGASP